MRPRLALLLIGLLTGLFVSPLFGAQRDAVVKIVCINTDGSLLSGSGVCVDREGVILTASHVVQNGTCDSTELAEVRVYFKDRAYRARPVVIPPQEGVAVIKVDADEELPFLEIADAPPQVGEQVWVMGFPQGKWSSYRTTVTSDQLFFADDRSTQLIGVFDPVIFGNSGGPLVTRDWKVAGIASVSGKIPPAMLGTHASHETVHVSGTGLDRTGGMFLTLRHVRDAYQEYLSLQNQNPIPNRENRNPILYAFTAAHCQACQQFKRDYHSGKFNTFDVRMIEYGSPEWQTAITEIQRYTRQQIPNNVPFFWIKGSRRFVQQRSYSASGLLQILAEILKGLGRIIFNPDMESKTTDSQPKWELNDREPLTESPPQEIDWSVVRVIVLAAEQNVGTLRNRLRKQVLSMSIGPLRRKLSELTNGKAEFDVVAERLTPDRFAAVVNAAGVSPEPVTILVLVEKQNLGFAKGLIAKKIEASLIGKFKAAPVEVIFERAHPIDYAAALEALQVQESDVQGERETSPSKKDRNPFKNDPLDPRNTIPTLAVAWLAERLTTKLKRRFAK